MFKKNTIKTVVSVIGIVLVSVILAGVASRLTDNFTDFTFRDLNEDNLLFAQYDDLETEDDDSGVTLENENGVIRIRRQKNNTEDKTSDYVYMFASVKLDAGEYTYTCFENPSIDTYYSYIKFTDANGVERTVVADFDQDDEDFEGGISDFYSTFTLEEETTVKCYILVKSDSSIKDIKAMPVLVEGDKAGDFYK